MVQMSSIPCLSIFLQNKKYIFLLRVKDKRQLPKKDNYRKDNSIIVNPHLGSLCQDPPLTFRLELYK
jgi:hypothetical protein